MPWRCVRSVPRPWRPAQPLLNLRCCLLGYLDAAFPAPEGPVYSLLQTQACPSHTQLRAAQTKVNNHLKTLHLPPPLPTTFHAEEVSKLPISYQSFCKTAIYFYLLLYFDSITLGSPHESPHESWGSRACSFLVSSWNWLVYHFTFVWNINWERVSLGNASFTFITFLSHMFVCCVQLFLLTPRPIQGDCPWDKSVGLAVCHRGRVSVPSSAAPPTSSSAQP